MNQHEQDRRAGENEGAQVQKELERQLREFGVSMSSAFEHGFEGRGQELGDQAVELGRAFVDVVNYGLSEAGRLLDLSPEEHAPDRKGTRTPRGDAPRYEPPRPKQAEHSRWTRSAFARQEGPEAALRASSRKRFGVGLVMCILGGLMAFSFFVSAFICFASTDLVGAGTVAETALAATGIGLMVGGGLFTWMAAEGSQRLEAAGQLKRYAGVFQGIDFSQGVPLEDLAGLLQQKKRKLRKNLRSLIRRDWMTAFLDEKTDRLFLSAEDYRAAQNIPTVPEPEPVPQKPAGEKAKEPEKPGEQAGALRLETVRQFAHVLDQQRQIMRDPQAAEELQHMSDTTRAICDWLEDHPESLPKTRRFAEYYIPTTLKLLHTYNDVQGQRGGNAEAIRRDIGGILHTLNTAFDNLHDSLLSDAALDVSSEIAALEGMLASDGLTGEGLL